MVRIPFLLLFLAALSPGARADHYVGGDITYTCLGGGQYEVVLDLYRDCSGVAFIDPVIGLTSACGEAFSDTLRDPIVTEVSGVCPSSVEESTCNGGALYGVARYRYTKVFQLGACPEWTIGWHICCRASAQNMVGTMGMYLEARLGAGSGPCDSSPVFGSTEVPYLCAGQPFSYNFGVSDPDGDSLRFDLISARYFSGAPQPIVYQPGMSGSTPVPGITFDSATGLMTFTAPQIGKYCVVLQATSFNAAGDTISTVMRDILFTVFDCTNEYPEVTAGVVTEITGEATLDGERSITTCPNGPITLKMGYTDPDAEQALSVVAHAAEALPGATYTTSGTNPVTLELAWDATGALPGDRAFSITATDDACPFLSIQGYTYEVKVLPPSAPACLATAWRPVEAPAPFRVFPDPSDGRFTLWIDGPLQRAEVLDLSGQVVCTHALTGLGGGTVIELPATCAAGTYVLRVIGEQGVSTTALHVAR